MVYPCLLLMAMMMNQVEISHHQYQLNQVLVYITSSMCHYCAYICVESSTLDRQSLLKQVRMIVMCGCLYMRVYVYVCMYACVICV